MLRGLLLKRVVNKGSGKRRQQAGGAGGVREGGSDTAFGGHLKSRRGMR